MNRFRREYDPHTRCTTDYLWDDAQKKMRINRTFDNTDIIDLNKAKSANNVDHRYGNEMLHHVAEIPLEIVFKWRKDHGVDIFSKDPWHRKKYKQLLNSPEWRYLRSNGRVKV